MKIKYKEYGEIQSIDTIKGEVTIANREDLENTETYYYDGTLQSTLEELFELGVNVKAWIKIEANSNKTIYKVEDNTPEED